MGLFKKIKKAVKKTVKAVTKPVQKVGKKVIPFIPGVSMAVRKNHAYYKTPTAQDTASGPAQIVEPPDKDNVDTENESSTESGKKKTRATGKKSLSVSRNSGGGLNI